MNEKITSSHLERAAYVYVRQSSMHQVHHHRESQQRQYALADEARKRGFQQVVVIDEDLGRSGGGGQERPGFARLVAAVCESKAGAVFALEASRLARNNRDWHHLVDLCTLTDTLVIDYDGVYDPRLLNDRLLLGLKGTMSEFELGLLRQRAQEALRQKVQRGEVISEVAVGYIRTADNRMEKTPDRQVQAAIEGVFAKFQELGSARQVLLWYRQEQIPLPTVRPGTGGQEIEWRLPINSRILAVLKNPVYAGAFVYGRRQTKTVLRNGRARKTDGHMVPAEQWKVLIQNHHPGYISWDEYQRNQQQLASNLRMSEYRKTGAAKTGLALLSGLLRCARCGRKLHVAYSGANGRVPRYHCRGGQLNHGTDWCISFGGLAVDRAVEAMVLETLGPLGIEAALEAWRATRRKENEKRKALRLALEKAQYKTHYARRQYDAVDPANRLVAGELEKRWNDALLRQEELENRLARVEEEAEPLTEERRERLLQLGADLDALWHHEAASASLKKRIVRTLIEEIVADVTSEPPEVHLRVHWAGGVHTLLKVRKNRKGQHGRSTERKVIDVVRELAQVCEDKSIASILNRLGYRTGSGNTWTRSRVTTLRNYHEIAGVDSEHDRLWLTLADAAKTLGVSKPVVNRLILEGILPAKQAVRYAPWIIERAALDLPAVQAKAQAVRAGQRSPRTAPAQPELPHIAGE